MKYNGTFAEWSVGSHIHLGDELARGTGNNGADHDARAQVQVRGRSLRWKIVPHKSHAIASRSGLQRRSIQREKGRARRVPLPVNVEPEFLILPPEPAPLSAGGNGGERHHFTSFSQRIAG